ncbi:MAG: FtsX-like permease family protein [bacterium]|nr:FtsX-like permease family protein [bacterium]
MNKMKRRPDLSAFSKRIIRKTFKDKDDSRLGDFYEIYNEYYEKEGGVKARIYFWKYVFMASPAIINNSVFRSITMFKNYLKIAFRNLLRYKGYSFINISGLSIGMACSILLFLYIQYEFSYDRYHEKADRIYRVVRDRRVLINNASMTTVTPGLLAPTLIEECPEVVNAVRILRFHDELVSHKEKDFIEEIFWTDPSVFDIFSIQFIKGSSKTAFTDPSSIVISERIAEKYFGEEEPLGKTMTLNEGYNFLVTGVFKNMPENSHFVMDTIVPLQGYFSFFCDNNNWGNCTYYTYILLREGADPAELESKFPPIIDPYFNVNVEENLKQIFFLQPISSIHLYSHGNQEINKNSDVNHIYFFISITFLILIVVCFNYINLAVAMAAGRFREIGIRKVIGAKKSQLIKQYLSESIILTTLASILAVISVFFALPYYSNFVGRALSFNLFTDPVLISGIISISVFIGLLGGSYPAFYFSSMKPVSILARKFGRRSKRFGLKNLLITSQFSITIILIVSSFIVKDQLDFIINKDIGYDKEQIIIIENKDPEISARIETLKAELKKNINISEVAASNFLPNKIINFLTGILPAKSPGEFVSAYSAIVDHDFLSLYNIKLHEGRNFSKEFPTDEGTAMLINETAANLIEWESPVGKEFTFTERRTIFYTPMGFNYDWASNKTGRIIGVMENFHLHSLHQPIEPLALFLNSRVVDKISIKINTTDIAETISYIEKIMNDFSPNYPYKYSFFDEIFENDYRAEQQAGSIFNYFAFLAIILACVGLFGLSFFTARQKTKEIGVRKVHGANIRDIIVLLFKDFTKWVLIANIIAWPAAYILMNNWLQNFAFRVDINWGIFILAGIMAFLFAVFTVSFQTIKAALANPVDSLRHE